MESIKKSGTIETLSKKKENGSSLRIKTESGINKEGLVTNSRNLGETEVVDVIENLYYESVDINETSANKGSLLTQTRKLGETEVVEL